MTAETLSYRIPSHMLTRMLIYLLTIIVHSVNAVVMMCSFRGELMKDPIVLHYYRNQTRFISCWTFVFQIAYAVMALTCDVMMLRRDQKHTKLLENLASFRDSFFSGVVVPFSFFVSSFFWAIYLYEKDLILPGFMNILINPISNHIVHTWIVPIVILEMTIRRRTVPKDHSRNLFLMVLTVVIYLTVLFYSYYEAGKWSYPILTYLQGTIYIKIFLIVTLCSLPMFYFSQWYITKIIWREKNLEKYLE